MKILLLWALLSKVVALSHKTTNKNGTLSSANYPLPFLSECPSLQDYDNRRRSPDIKLWFLRRIRKSGSSTFAKTLTHLLGEGSPIMYQGDELTKEFNFRCLLEPMRASLAEKSTPSKNDKREKPLRHKDLLATVALHHKDLATASKTCRDVLTICGENAHRCSSEFCPQCPGAHLCDKTCGICHAENATVFTLPTDGITFASKHVFFVTHLREPIARTRSEFFFHVAGSHSDNCGGLGCASEAVWKSWLENNQSCTLGGGYYVGNAIVRSFSGSSSYPDRRATGCGPCEGLGGGTPFLNGCSGKTTTPPGPSSCPDAHKKMAPYLPPVTSTDLATADAVLERFDLVRARHLSLVPERQKAEPLFLFRHLGQHAHWCAFSPGDCS